MKYECEILIDLPRERVIELFDNPENLPKWQKGLQSFELISGEEGKPGAKSRLVYDMDGREVVMIETIVTRNIPDEFTATFEAPGVYNLNKNLFYEHGPNQTRWVVETEFKMTSLVMRFMGIFMRSSFPKETMKNLEAFKAFAEAA